MREGGVALSKTIDRCLLNLKHINGYLQTAQEVGFLDSLPPGFAGTPDDLRALSCAFGSIGQWVLRKCVTVVRSWCDVLGMVVGRNLGREDGGAGGQFLLIALSLLLVQRCEVMLVLALFRYTRAFVNILLTSTPPLSALDCLLASPRRSHNQSGYSESSLANTSGLFLK